MLLRFGVANHLSIKEYQEVSLVAATAIKDKAAALLQSDAINESVLPAIVVYGANGSGKTNLLNALIFLRTAVVRSASEGDPDSGIPTRPFKLDHESADQPTKLDCDFVHQGVRYHFGVSMDNKRVVEEYLFAYPKNRPQKWYHRHLDEIEFGRNLRGKNAATFELTRKNSLFVSVAAKANHEQLSSIFGYFKEKIIDYDNVPPFGQGDYQVFCDDDNKKAQVIDLLKMADFSISDITSKKRLLGEDQKEFQHDFEELIRKHLGGRELDLGEALEQVREIRFAHVGKEDQLYELPLGFESRGTQTFLNLIAPILTALDKGQTLVIDELDTSLHSKMGAQLLKLFNKKVSNQTNAQLLFTTHDTNLLDPRVIRRDQVWFTEKTGQGETRVFSLADFKTRNTDDFEKAYLQGRFGAVPITQDLLETLED